MTARIGGFKTQDDARRYFEMYDRFVEKHWPVDRVERDVPTAFGPTHVGVSGAADEQPLVLIHPTSGSSLGWHSLIAPLAARHTVYAPDTVGTIGRSVQTAQVGSPKDLVLWLDQVLDGLGLSHTHLLGYSEGGWIACLYAALCDRPKRLTSLTLIEPAGAIGVVPSRTLAALIYRAARTLTAKDKPQAVRDLNHWMNGDISLSDDEVELVLASFGTFRQKLPKPRRLTDDQLRRIETPTLLMLGAETRIYDPLEVEKRASELLADVQIVTISNAGHGLPFQYPEMFTNRVLAFLEAPHIAT